MAVLSAGFRHCQLWTRGRRGNGSLHRILEIMRVEFFQAMGEALANIAQPRERLDGLDKPLVRAVDARRLRFDLGGVARKHRFDQCDRRHGLKAQHDDAFCRQMQVEKVDHHIRRGKAGLGFRASVLGRNETFRHQHRLLEALFPPVQPGAIRLDQGRFACDIDQLLQHLVDALLDAGRSAHEVAIAVVGQKHGADQVGDHGRNRCTEDQCGQLVNRRTQISSDEIGHEGEHADGKPSRPEGATIDRQEDDRQENDIGDVAVALQHRGQRDHRDANDDGDYTGHELFAVRAVADGKAAFDRERNGKAVGCRRQWRHEIVEGHQQANRRNDRRGDARRLAQPGKGRIIGEKPVAHAGANFHRMPFACYGDHRRVTASS